MTYSSLAAEQLERDVARRDGRPYLDTQTSRLRVVPRGELYLDDRERQPREPQTDTPARGKRRAADPSRRRLTDYDVSALKRLMLGKPGRPETGCSQVHLSDFANLAPSLLAQIASTRRGAAVAPMESFIEAMEWLDRMEREQDPVRHDLIRSMRESPNVGKTGHTTAASREGYWDGKRMRRMPQRFTSTGHALGGRGARVTSIAGGGFRVDGGEVSPIRSEHTAADPYAATETLRTAEDFTLAGAM